MNPIRYVNGAVAYNQADPWEGIPFEQEAQRATRADVPRGPVGGGQLHADHHRRLTDWRPNYSLIVVED